MWEKSSVIGVADYVIKLSCWLITFLLKVQNLRFRAPLSDILNCLLHNI